MPPQELYRPLNINQWVNADGVSTRDKCYFSEMLDEMEPEAAEFWKQIVIVISSRKLKNLILRSALRAAWRRQRAKRSCAVSPWLTWWLDRKATTACRS